MPERRISSVEDLTSGSLAENQATFIMGWLWNSPLRPDEGSA